MDWLHVDGTHYYSMGSMGWGNAWRVNTSAYTLWILQMNDDHKFWLAPAGQSSWMRGEVRLIAGPFDDLDAAKAAYIVLAAAA